MTSSKEYKSILCLIDEYKKELASDKYLHSYCVKDDKSDDVLAQYDVSTQRIYR